MNVLSTPLYSPPKPPIRKTIFQAAYDVHVRDPLGALPCVVQAQNVALVRLFLAWHHSRQRVSRITSLVYP